MDFSSSTWSDVTPLPQDDGPAPVCSIAYKPAFSTAMSYFRALLAVEEVSERALSLTRHVIGLNAANYTAWYYRRVCLFSLNKDLNEELDYIDTVTVKGSKNYQLWYHRRVVVERLGDCTRELVATSEQLSMDAKNYHAWTHRQWVLRHFGCWEDELKYVETLIDDDVRNNSAWNQRWYVVSHTSTTDNEEENSETINKQSEFISPQSVVLSPDVKLREIEYTLRQIEKAVNNESPYAYLRGIVLAHNGENYGKYSEFPIILETLHRLRFSKSAEDVNQNVTETETESFDSNTLKDSCAPLLALLVDIYIQEKNKLQIQEICKILGNDVDKMRAKYWMHIARKYKNDRECTPNCTSH